MKKVKIGIIGFGTVGAGVADILHRRRREIASKAGVDLELACICDKDLSSKRSVKVPKRLLTRDIRKLLYDPSIDIVVELIGGLHPAKDFILEALRQGKHVVTANKALLSESLDEILPLARSCGLSVGFEASVGGGIPIIRGLRQGLVANRIELIYGIVNGTSNFILSSMEDELIGFDEALARAQEKGYAERNPALDTSGADSAHKLSILAYLGFGLHVKPSRIFTEGITGIEALDIEYARQFGYAIRLLAIAKLTKNGVELRVHPTLIPRDHLLASVKGVFNAIYARGDLTGDLLFYGKGAGRYPTASAVISDLVSIAKGATRCGHSRAAAAPDPVSRLSIVAMESIKTRHYIRLSAIDKPGVLKGIAGILAKYGVSISNVTQKEEGAKKTVPVVMMTHATEESSVEKALGEIGRLAAIRKAPVRIRVEE